MARLNLAALWPYAQLATAAVLARDYPSDNPLEACPGYKASNIKTSSVGLTADLKLAGAPCNVYGTDLDHLVLEVTYETGRFSIARLHTWTVTHARAAQILVFMSRFRMLRTRFIRSPRPSCPGQMLQPGALPMARSNSPTRRIPSRSLSRVLRAGRCCSTLLPPALSSNLSISV